METSRLSLLGRLVLALLAVFVLGAMIASAAQAVEPTRALVWKVNGKVLGENETKELAVKVAGNGKLLLESAGKIRVTCEEAKLAKGSFLANEGGVNGQAITETSPEFSKCKVEGNGTNCTKVEEPIKVKPVRSEFVLNDLEPGIGNKVLVEFTPRSKKLFVNLIFEGTECKFKNAEVINLVVGEVFTDKTVSGSETQVELGALPAETTSYVTIFPHEPKSVFLWSNANKKWELFEPTYLKLATEKAELKGTVLTSLAGGEKYGFSETGK